MTSEIQANSNKENAQKSTGPNDTSVTRFNAVKYGLTGKCFMTPEEVQVTEEIYEDLVQTFNPKDSIERFLVYRMAQIIIRLQKINQIESATLQNSLTSKENWESNPVCQALEEPLKNPDEKPLLKYEDLTKIELLARYETNLENRLTKILKVYYEKQEQRN
ncbi:MAG: hypothetical protein WC821_01135 [archaeon]